MGKLLFFLSLIICPYILQAQIINNDQVCTYCKCDNNNCGPWEEVNNTDKIIGTATAQSPYNDILHIETHRNYLLKREVDYGTVSFISQNILITANHVVSHKKALKEIRLSVSNLGSDDWITFEKNDFEIYYYSEKGDVSEDIAVVKILNKEKLSKVYHSSFSIATLEDKKFGTSDVANLSGYPCYFANDPKMHDTLINRKCKITSIDISKPNFVAYHFFTCIGDSGAPLWIEKDQKYYVVGIHHGGGGDAGFPDTYNVSVRIDDKILTWLNSFIK